MKGKFGARYTRLAAFLLLAAVSAYGASVFFSSDWREALLYWQHSGSVVAIVIVLRLLDLFLDAAIWYRVQWDFGTRLSWRRGFLTYMSAYAGLLLPVQLGRVVRADAIVRMGAGGFRGAITAELAVVVLSGIAALALLAGTVTYVLVPWLAPLAAAIVVFTMLLFFDWVSVLLPKKLAAVPSTYWRRPATFLIVALITVGWMLVGASFYMVVRDLPGNLQLWQAWIIAPANLILGAGTGLPGGIGAVEALLGVSLSMLDVPPAHMAFAVGAFRLLTFWIWIPLGWIALLLANRIARRRACPAETREEVGDAS